MRIPSVRPFAVAVVVTLGAGCADDTHGDDTTFNCEADTRDEEFRINLSRTGPGGYGFTIVSADPVTPVRGNNTWVIDVSHGGAPVTPADAMLKVTPFMPDHQHGTGTRAVWTPDPMVPGRYSVGPINLWMPGIWELRFEATPTAGPRDGATFVFCLTG